MRAERACIQQNNQVWTSQTSPISRWGGRRPSNTSNNQDGGSPQLLTNFPVDTSAPCGSGRACPRHMCQLREGGRRLTSGQEEPWGEMEERREVAAWKATLERSQGGERVFLDRDRTVITAELCQFEKV